jgi:peptidoglycan/LPS O-acetylase OafA/YrhL
MIGTGMQSENHSLNTVRGVAALLVVASHLQGLLFISSEDAPQSFWTRVFYVSTSLGGMAVLVFFCLSGYWVGGSVLRQFRERRFEWADYTSRRLTRLWIVVVPALAVTGVADTLGAAFFPSAGIYLGSPTYDWVTHGSPGGHHGMIPLLATLGFVQAIRVPTYGTNSPLWSLAYEFWYYVAFPLTMLAMTERRWLRRLGYVFAMLLVVLVVWNLQVVVLGSAWLIGAAASAVPTPRFLRRGICQAVSVVVVITTMVTLREAGRLPAPAAPLILGGVAAVMVISLRHDVRPHRVLLFGSWLGRFSYSLYAIHNPLAVAAAALASGPGGRWTLGVQSLSASAVLLIAVVAVAYVFASATEAKTDTVRTLVRAKFHQAHRALGRQRNSRDQMAKVG